METNTGLKFKEEIKIPVPWGYMSAKIWGHDSATVPVLALHGWQDNAGSFDTLAPLIKENIQLVCVEFCGHGLSSHYPPGMFLTYIDHIYHVKLVVDYFDWAKVTILGHSMGGHVALVFASMFPERVHKLISLDALKMYSSSTENFPKKMKSILSDYQKVALKMEQAPATSITYNLARAKLLKNYKGSVDEKHADILLLRGLKKISDNDEYQYTRDMRTIILPSVFHEFTTDHLKSIARGISCPFLLITAKNSITSVSSEPRELHAEFVEIYRNASSDFRYVEVDGRHHVHLTHPHIIAPYICDFLSSK